MKFTTAQIFSAATGILCCEMKEVFAVLNFITCDNLFTHQLPRAMRSCETYIREQCPWIDQLEVDKCTPETWRDFIADAVVRFGAEHELNFLAPGVWTHIDPITELTQLMGNREAIVVVAPPQEPSKPEPL